MCQSHQIDQIPLVDGKNKIIGLHVLNKIILSEKKKNRVVLMVGGLGKRLRPLTNNTPKPMLHVGGRPILQTIVEGFVSSGFTNITMCLGYKSEQIQNFFKDGAQFGAQIDYVVEDKRMGTAGALTLLRQNLQEPFFVMNGDLLTNINYKKMLDFHIEHESDATMCVREYDFEVPFGVVNTENEKIIAIKEKPTHSFYVNAGIYLLNVDCINLIPDNEYYDMTSLFEDIIIKGKNAVSFPLQEYWLDIGRVSEYQQANDEFHKVF
jgi:NDP-sugar pyrophosphorylase family protein